MAVLPIYILADRSSSMAVTAGSGTAIELVQTVIADLLKRLARDPTIQRSVRVAVVSFNDGATVDLPLSRLTSATVTPPLHASGSTSFAAVFDVTAAAITHDLAGLGGARPPMIFMLTDGRATAQRDRDYGWRAEHARLMVSGGAAGRPMIVPFGYGSVHVETLRAISSDAGAAYVADRSVSPADAIEQFAELIFGSVAASVPRRAPELVRPPGSAPIEYDENY